MESQALHVFPRLVLSHFLPYYKHTPLEDLLYSVLAVGIMFTTVMASSIDCLSIPSD